jgi:hypothetical protein
VIDEREVVQHAADRLAPPEPAFDRLLRRRDRKQRNQRISAGVIGVAVFVAALGIIARDMGWGFNVTPVGPSPSTAPMPARGLTGIAPKGAEPSRPVHGELIVGFSFGHTEGDPGRYDVNVYADGRLIWRRLGDISEGTSTTGWLEQRLTPEGVELMRAEVLATGLFDRGDVHFVEAQGLYFGDIRVSNGSGSSTRVSWGGIGVDEPSATTPTAEQAAELHQLDERFAAPDAWLPAAAWADEVARPFVPSSYSVCYGTESDHEVRFDDLLSPFPVTIRSLLASYDPTPEVIDQPAPSPSIYRWCSTVTTDEARSLNHIFVKEHFQGAADTFGVHFLRLHARDPSWGEVTLEITPRLPDDR